ncbi:hypothetical protein LJC63_07915, partial [Ruminococcaceae bacterium OttesenSCG-928-L11]|nr:hypothetical protein [Ruminococcaceae bacterium OttesenSCG-928-L11]
KFNRYDLKVYHKALGDFIHDYNKLCTSEEKVRFVLIPEMHKDGAWHMHGLLTGIRSKDLEIPEYIQKRNKKTGEISMVKNTKKYAVWKQYARKFGHISIGKIGHQGKTANYITKYITKEMTNTVNEYGASSYYCSRGLKKSELLYRGTDVHMSEPYDYERPDGFCKVKWFPDADSFTKAVKIGDDENG